MHHSLIGTDRHFTECKNTFRNGEFKSLVVSIQEVMKYANYKLIISYINKVYKYPYTNTLQFPMEPGQPTP